MVLGELPFITRVLVQRVIHAATRIVAGLGPRDRAIRTFRELHWLPVVYRTGYKLCVMMHAAVRGGSPKYINDISTPNASIPGQRNHRSIDSCIRCATLWKHKKESLLSRRSSGME